MYSITSGKVKLNFCWVYPIMKHSNFSWLKSIFIEFSNFQTEYFTANGLINIPSINKRPYCKFKHWFLLNVYPEQLIFYTSKHCYKSCFTACFGMMHYLVLNCVPFVLLFTQQGKNAVRRCRSLCSSNIVRTHLNLKHMMEIIAQMISRKPQTYCLYDFGQFTTITIVQECK